MAVHAHKPRLDPATLRDLSQDGEGPRLLDVRTPGEFRTAHIPGSYNVPLDTLREHRAELLHHLDEDVILICRSGARAAQAEQALAEAGLPHLRVLDGGVMAWETTGGPLVPALALLGGLPMTVAVGTSLLVISMKSFAGLAGYLAGMHIDWGFAALVTATAVVGSVIGGLLAGRIPQDALRKSFGWFVAVMGVFVLSQQISSDLRHTLLTSPWTWASVAAASGVAFSWYMLRNAERTRSLTNDVSAPSIEENAPAVHHPTGEHTVHSSGTAPSPHDV
ncbi:TSUP family transporter [Streptomyces sp. NBC_00481]|nr:MULTISPECIES: TSUP family transporter [unclassified Streptomyces]WRY95197.1 TSUP family transporter [Streptomyces sp. NBC_00481]